ELPDETPRAPWGEKGGKGFGPVAPGFTFVVLGFRISGYERLGLMLELQLTLDFSCCACDHLVNVTVKCTGKGLAAGGRTVAAVNVPCPTCGSVNRVYFEPSGTVRDVAPCHGNFQWLEPSIN